MANCVNSLWYIYYSSKDGKTATSSFISGMYGSVPPLQEMFNMAGMELPEYLKGKNLDSDDQNNSVDVNKE
ncbi:hypothetical protein [Aequorivita viscosa]|uniref:Flotillin n=1 Tax=Aequorivita viscosa TaxID=797419 RepID=A0A1M6DRR7_9FLAO|nr:flotillin [Aequorivita viscosa]SHI75934.1 flotillin [Aequorivita viscosa]